MAATYNGSVANLVDPLANSSLSSPSHSGQHTEINDALQALGVWQAWTPTFTTTGTAPAIGNGTMIGRYTVFNKTVIAQFFFSAGSTTTFGTGTLLFSLPVNSSSTVNAFSALGSGFVIDESAQNSYVCNVDRKNTADKFGLRFTGGTFADVTGTAPFTMANTDTIRAQLVYEAA
jgi:hypothetical protein